LTSGVSHERIAIETQRLTPFVEGFLLTCNVEGKSPNTITFYKGILERFPWYLNEFG
jgi:hypothetical protein